ncbi:MAG: hypothetical protein IPJ34_36580 [Myxococcales bacterium]|nr:hypothetical protein [Myxococcales bacterium]
MRRSLALFAVLGWLGCGGATGATDLLDDGSVKDAEEETTDTGGGDTGGGDTGATDTGADTGGGPGPIDTGPDGSACATCGLDTDCDGIPDSVEGRYAPAGAVDTDKDGTPDYLDDDSDGDGIPDKLEWRTAGCDPSVEGNDADGDGVPNFQDLDSDGNGLPDKDEVCPPAAVLTKLGYPACVVGVPYDFDGDGVPDFVDFDNDHDSSKADKSIGLADAAELKDNTGKYVGLVDTDGDGIPDVYDVDSDGDFILDLDDGVTDPDGDKIPAFRDKDSDGDGVPDSCEARGSATPTAADVTKPLADTDGDGIPDYLDLDSDNDFLADGKEDLNGDCLVGATETNRLKGDTDGDGVGDLGEVALLGVAAAKDPTTDPYKAGKFFFIEPYSVDGSAKPSPASTPLALSTKLNQADVAFAIDTTTSMDGIEANLASSIASKIIPGLAAKIPDLGLGVVGYDDALSKPWGDSAGDSFVWFPNGKTTGSDITTTTADAIAAAGKLTKTTPGGSYPEGTVPALWWLLTGDAMTFVSSSAGTTKSFPAVTGLTSAQFGGIKFRKSALPILINTSDANMHNGLTTGCNVPVGTTAISSSLCLPIAYASNAASASSIGHSPTISELLTKMNALGAKYIGVSVHGPGGSRSSALDRTLDASYYASAVDMLYLARGTGAKVPPSVLGGTALDCKTSQAGATANPADLDGQCPLVFDIGYTGTGLGDTVVNSVVALLDAIKFDVYVQAIPTPSGGVDPVDAFMQSVLPLPAGGTDPVSGKTCVTFPTTATADNFVGPKATTGKDSLKETILDLTPGPLYCFSVVPKPNTTVIPTTSAQVFRADLRTHAQRPPPPAGPGGTFVLGADREVLFVVPPKLN